MAEGDAAYAMAIESAALAFATCDRRLRPQLCEAFAEALELRGAAVAGLYPKSAVLDVLDDIFSRIADLFTADLVPVHEHVLRERAESLLRKVLAEVSSDFLVEWPFPDHPNGGDRS